MWLGVIPLNFCLLMEKALKSTSDLEVLIDLGGVKE